MKKINLSGRLSLNKIKISELNSLDTIIGGACPGGGTTVPHTQAKLCNSTPQCCLTLGTCTSKVCPTNVIPCAEDTLPGGCGATTID